MGEFSKRVHDFLKNFYAQLIQDIWNEPDYDKDSLTLEPILTSGASSQGLAYDRKISLYWVKDK